MKTVPTVLTARDHFTKPSLRPQHGPLLVRGWTAIQEGDRTRYAVHADWSPGRQLSAAERADFEEFAGAAERWLAPASTEWLRGRLVVLFAHYPQREAPDVAVLGHVISDWLDGLQEYPASVIEQAVLEWVRTRRPTLADIRGECEDAVARTRRDLAVVRLALKVEKTL